MQKTKKKEKWEMIAREYVVSPFPVFALVESMTDDMKKVFSRSLSSLAEKFENNSVIYFYKSSDWRTMHNFLVNKVKKNPKFLEKVFTQINKFGKQIVKFSESVKQENLSQKTNKQLWQYYNEYCQLNTRFYSYGLIISLLDFGETTFLSDEITNFLKQKISNNLVSQYFSILTTPLKDTADKQSDIELLKIYRKIKNNKKLFNLFNNPPKEVWQKLPDIDLTIFKLLKKHTKKWAWLPYVYEGPAADEFYFIEIIKDFIRRHINPEKEIIKYKNDKIKLKNKQNEIIKKLKPNNYYQKIIFLAQEAGWIKVFRRSQQTHSYYNIELLLKEIALRIGLSLKQVRMLLSDEVNGALLYNKININLINKRLKLFIYVKDNNKTKKLIGNDANKFLKNTVQVNINKNIKKLIGTTACPGKVKGKITIVNTPDDIKNMKVGNILISFSTNPNLMPAIRKARAIVTDEGGLTCHAAIVSRELDIPCVVGTKIATKVLKDGDLVEVDANKGVIRKIK